MPGRLLCPKGRLSKSLPTGNRTVTRRLEELPSGAVEPVRLLVTDRADRRRFGSKAVFNVNWTENELELIDTVRAFHVPSGEGYI
jgi:NADPH-dependent ferric siderophore reductase